MKKSEFAMRVSLVARIAAQYTNELTHGIWNPDFCSADAGYARERFLEEIDNALHPLRDGPSEALADMTKNREGK